MSDWAICCAEEDRALARRAVAQVDATARLCFVDGPDALRHMVRDADPGDYGVVIGPTERGVSDVNLAAAVAEDGNARCIVLARGDVTGSLRSRAARAGVDLVIDFSELEPESGGEGGEKDDGGDGDDGRASAEPLSPPPEEAPRAPLTRREDDPARAPVLVLCSGRGGVGKTAVAAAGAATAARWGMRVCLLDLDLSCGNAHAAFGLSGGTDLAALGAVRSVGPELLGRLLVSAGPGVSLAGPCARPETAELAFPLAGQLIECAARQFDLVIVDTSTTFTDAVAQAAQAADRLLLVSDGRAGSVSALARMSGLAVRLGVARTRIARVENHVDPRARRGPVPGGAEVGLEAARVYRVCEGGQEVADLLAGGRAHEAAEPGYAFSDSVGTAMAQLLAELGRLPSCDEARRAAEGREGRGLRGIFAWREAK